MRGSKTRAFYIETLVLTFVLLFVLAILMRVFGAAGSESLSAKRKTAASIIAQNLVSEFQAGTGEIGDSAKELLKSGENEDSGEIPTSTFVLSYSEDGSAASDGVYLASVQMAREERMVGYMLTMTASIHFGGSEEILAAIDSAKYIPDNNSDYLLGGSDFDLEDLSAEGETEADTSERDLSDETVSENGGYEEDSTEDDVLDETESELTRVVYAETE